MFKLLLTILFCLPFLCQAQSLTLKKGSISKTLGPETYYIFYFGDTNTECCNTTVKGEVTRVFSDSIQVRLNEIRLFNKDLDFLTDLKLNLDEQNLLYMLPKADMLHLTAYKNRKRMKIQETFGTIAGVLIVTSLVTLASSYDLDQKEFRKGVLIAGGAQIGLAISLGIFTRKKQFAFSDGWSF